MDANTLYAMRPSGGFGTMMAQYYGDLGVNQGATMANQMMDEQNRQRFKNLAGLADNFVSQRNWEDTFSAQERLRKQQQSNWQQSFAENQRIHDLASRREDRIAAMGLAQNGIDPTPFYPDLDQAAGGVAGWLGTLLGLKRKNPYAQLADEMTKRYNDRMGLERDKAAQKAFAANNKPKMSLSDAVRYKMIIADADKTPEEKQVAIDAMAQAGQLDPGDTPPPPAQSWWSNTGLSKAGRFRAMTGLGPDEFAARTDMLEKRAHDLEAMNLASGKDNVAYGPKIAREYQSVVSELQKLRRSEAEFSAKYGQAPTAPTTPRSQNPSLQSMLGLIQQLRYGQGAGATQEAAAINGTLRQLRYGAL